MFAARNLGEFIIAFKEESGLTYDEMADRLKISRSTLHRMRRGDRVDTSTLDTLADLAHVDRQWLYDLAYGIQHFRKYPPVIASLAEFLSSLPPDIQEEADVLVRTLVAARSKSNNDKKK